MATTSSRPAAGISEKMQKQLRNEQLALTCLGWTDLQVANASAAEIAAALLQKLNTQPPNNTTPNSTTTTATATCATTTTPSVTNGTTTTTPSVKKETLVKISWPKATLPQPNKPASQTPKLAVTTLPPEDAPAKHKLLEDEEGEQKQSDISLYNMEKTPVLHIRTREEIIAPKFDIGTATLEQIQAECQALSAQMQQLYKRRLQHDFLFAGEFAHSSVGQEANAFRASFERTNNFLWTTMAAVLNLTKILQGRFQKKQLVLACGDVQDSSKQRTELCLEIASLSQCLATLDCLAQFEPNKIVESA